ncbi:hypothetical protein [Azospirillum sp.]|uniref:hypothetical protein n=1 Tax=Azospirillum sp. TaxID=34012 RepID=UPI002D698367|nr:hypothetical protein [Azospirillum sp.]HYD71380.1 hypothetical protein [Azospirillum sp.]
MTATPLMPRPMLRRLGLAAVAAGITACANPAADQAISAQSALVGMPKSTLLSCAGVPERQAVADSREFYTYQTGRIVSYPVTTGFYGGPWRPWGYGGWGWPSYAADVRSYACEATFTLRNGVVERVVYGGGSSLGECGAIVRNCLAQTPQPQMPPSPAPQSMPPRTQ